VQDIGGLEALVKGEVLLAVGATFLAIMIARGLMVYPTALTIGKHWPKGWKHVVFWSGLKGSIPLALVLGLPAGELKQTLVPIAFGVVLVSLLLQGLTIGPLIRKTGVSCDS
jgi:CPA1 family monovalent cation:H+ antiporter